VPLLNHDRGTSRFVENATHLASALPAV
jgi:hypothetical protein